MVIHINSTELALKHGLMLNDIAANNDKLQQKLRSRARELPSLVMSNGLVATLLFYMSKAEKAELIMDAIDFFSKDQKHDTSSTTSKNHSPDKFAYALMIGSILTSLRELGIIKFEIKDEISEIINLILNELQKKEIIAIGVIEEYLISLKRVAEILWEDTISGEEI